jgi:hypothetical protein
MHSVYFEHGSKTPKERERSYKLIKSDMRKRISQQTPMKSRKSLKNI